MIPYRKHLSRQAYPRLRFSSIPAVACSLTGVEAPAPTPLARPTTTPGQHSDFSPIPIAPYEPITTLRVERRRGDFWNRSIARTYAQSRAEFESSRARVHYWAGCEFSPATLLRPAALQSNRKRFLAAYGDGRITLKHLVQGQPPGKSARQPDGAHGHSTGTVHEMPPRFGYAACAPVPTTGQTTQRPCATQLMPQCRRGR